MTPATDLSTFSPAIVIDDDEFFRVAIEVVLRDHCSVEDVVLCATIDEALASLAGGRVFRLGLVDLNMDGATNRELLDAVSAAQPGMRLVVVSASRAREDVLMAISAGARGFIHKGLGIGEAEAALRQIAAGTVYVPPLSVVTDGGSRGSEEPPERKAAQVAALTPRQREVLTLLVAGQSNKGIARAMNIQLGTVKFHLSFIYQILGVTNRVEAAMAGAKLLEP